MDNNTPSFDQDNDNGLPDPIFSSGSSSDPVTPSSPATPSTPTTPSSDPFSPSSPATANTPVTPSAHNIPSAVSTPPMPNLPPRSASSLQAKDPNLAWLELIGLLGFLGIGYLVTDQVEQGMIRLIGFMVFLFVGWAIVGLLSFVLIGLCLIPVMLAAQVGIPIWSAVQLRQQLLEG